MRSSRPARAYEVLSACVLDLGAQGSGRDVGLEHERGGVGSGKPVVEPVHPVGGDRGHIDQHNRDHHEKDRETEELTR